MNNEDENKFYDNKFQENIKIVNEILQKEKINIIDKKLCCLYLRHSLENICYKILLFYKDYLIKESLKQYSVGYIIDFIVPFIPFLDNGNKIKIEIKTTEGNVKSWNCGNIDISYIKKYYNKLGEFLHEIEPSKLIKYGECIIEKEKLEEICNYIVKFKNSLLLIKIGEHHKCEHCQHIFLYQRYLKNFFCPNCFTEYKNNNGNIIKTTVDVVFKIKNKEVKTVKNKIGILHDMYLKLKRIFGKNNINFKEEDLEFELDAFDEKNEKCKIKYNPFFFKTFE